MKAAARQDWRLSPIGAEPTWPAEWEAKYRGRWQTRTDEKGLFPAPAPPKPRPPKRDECQFFIIIARRPT